MFKPFLIIFLVFCTAVVYGQQVKIDTTVTIKPPFVFRFNAIQVQPTPVAANYYAKNLSFFCANELKFEKATKIPFKFRLGSVDYTDKMEGKNQR